MRILNQKLFVVAFSLLPLIYLLLIWDKIPVSVPTHFDGNMQPDDYSSRIGFLGAEALLCGVALGIYFLFQNLQYISPKNTANSSTKLLGNIGVLVVVFLVALSFFTIHLSLKAGGSQPSDFRILFVGLGLFFSYLGYAMHNVKPNLWIGFRLPWTMANDYVWTKTHAFAGKLWMAGGLIIAVAGVALSITGIQRGFMPFILILIALPSAYSFIIYKQQARL